MITWKCKLQMLLEVDLWCFVESKVTTPTDPLQWAEHNNKTTKEKWITLILWRTSWSLSSRRRSLLRIFMMPRSLYVKVWISNCLWRTSSVTYMSDANTMASYLTKITNLRDHFVACCFRDEGHGWGIGPSSTKWVHFTLWTLCVGCFCLWKIAHLWEALEWFHPRGDKVRNNVRESGWNPQPSSHWRGEKRK